MPGVQVTSPTLIRGREAFQRKAWKDAHAFLLAADREAPLTLEDLERLGEAAYLVGLVADTTSIQERAHREALRSGNPCRAAWHAFWLGLSLLDRGEQAQAGGWFARADRILDDAGVDCVERGYLLMPSALGSVAQGDHEAAFATYVAASAIAERFGDTDLATLARLGQGEEKIALGDVRAGVELLDEAMVAVRADQVSPIVVGIVYCSVIDTFQAIFDVRRAQEWTTALSRWCDSQPDLVPYRGQCRLQRARLMQLRGDWRDADEEARLAREWLSRPSAGDPAIGEAVYQQAELHRLQGRLADAETGYREASRHGRRPEPGLALLRLAQGQVRPALASVRRALAEAPDPPTRSRLLEPAVEIALAAGDIEGARRTAEELGELAASLDAPLLQAMAARANGAVLLEAGQWEVAIGVLRSAWSAWQAIGAPYEAARAQVLVARACRALDDEDAAAMELDAARRVFDDLSAAPDLAAVEFACPGVVDSESRRAHRPRARGSSPRRVGPDESSDRFRPRPEREDRGPSRCQHLHEARSVIAGGGDGLRVRAGSGPRARLGSRDAFPTCQRSRIWFTTWAASRPTPPRSADAAEWRNGRPTK